ncbi:MAG: EamA family transporter [Candidatus Hydrogenedentota bacterium]|nr:MAG: EamA family transporter [Candidatus Hydrogenedentota bacterium]
MIPAFLNAILFGTNALVAKGLSEKGLTDRDLLFTNFSIGAVPLFLFAFLLGKWRFPAAVLPVFFGAVAGNLLAVTLYFRALRFTEVSIALPLISLSPVFILVTAPVIVGERIGPLGIAGVLLVGMGAYLLGASRNRASFAAPVLALSRDRGARYALAVALVWSVTANFDKLCLRYLDPYVYPAVFSAAMALFSLPCFRRFWPSGPDSAWPARLKTGASSVAARLGLGLSYGFMLAAHMFAMMALPVAYVIAIKRAGMLAGIAEDARRRTPGRALRAAGAIAILIGIAIIVLRGGGAS